MARNDVDRLKAPEPVQVQAQRLEAEASPKMPEAPSTLPEELKRPLVCKKCHSKFSDIDIKMGKCLSCGTSIHGEGGATLGDAAKPAGKDSFVVHL
ncbi:hypothetical protein IIA79_01085 [bacterium]|nr:hypothetical protein [bacterium]